MTIKHVFFPDRPVGLTGDLLWDAQENLPERRRSSTSIRDQIRLIAETIVGPLFDGTGSEPTRPTESITFAIHGRWGMGKSSALRMIREQATLLAAEREGTTDRVLFCDYNAPAYENLEFPVRTTLALRLLTSIAGSPQRAVEQFLQVSVATGSLTGDDLPQHQGTGSVNWTGQALQRVAATLSQLVDFDRVIADHLVGSPSSASTSRVLVVMIDDLDRCQKDHIWRVLDTIQQFSAVPNLFFVLAVDQRQLHDTIAERLPQTGTVQNPDFALEKYVQLALWVPDMDDSVLREYVGKLLQPESQEAGHKELDSISKTVIDNVRFLQLGLRVKTPRSVKRCLNIIRSDLSRRLEECASDLERSLALKERVLEYVWPDFYRQHLSPAKNQKRSLARRSFTLLEEEARSFVASGGDDEEQLRLGLRRVDSFFRSTWDTLDVALITFLGTGPYWFTQNANDGPKPIESFWSRFYDTDAPGSLQNDGLPPSTSFWSRVFDADPPATRKAAHPSFSLDGLEDLGRELGRRYIECEAAEAAEERERCIRLAAEFFEFAYANRERIPSSNSDYVGNVAITSEKMGATELAVRLYELALDLDAQHSNNARNYVDFIVKQEISPLYPRAEGLIEMLRSAPQRDHRPERTEVLAVQLAALNGKQLEVQSDLVTGKIERFNASPSDVGEFAEVMMLLSRLNRYEGMQTTARVFFDSSLDVEKRYVAVRGLSDALASSENHSHRRQAMDMYRSFVSRPLFECEDNDDRADALHNYATLLHTAGYVDEAGAQWFLAYKLDPEDQIIRRAYSLHLVIAKQATLAQCVTNGLPLDEMPVHKERKALPDHFLEGDAERWWDDL